MVDAENGYNSNIANIVKAGIILVWGGGFTYIITKQLKFKETMRPFKVSSPRLKMPGIEPTVFFRVSGYYVIEASLTSLKKYKELLINSKRNFNNFKY